MEKRIFVYSKPNCPWCSLVLHVLDIAELPVVHEKFDDPVQRNQFIHSIQSDYVTKQNTFPVVFVGDDLIGGCTETIEWLKINGYKVSLI
jgi:glutaredoxin